MTCFLNQTPRLDWYVVRWGLENQHHEGACLNEIWIMSSNINNYSTLNSENNWEDLCIQLRNQQTCTLDDHN